MRVNAQDDCQKEQRAEFLDNFQNLYNDIGKADEDNDSGSESDREEYKEEAGAKKSKSSFLSKIFGGSKSKVQKPVAQAPGSMPMSSAAPVRSRLNDDLSSNLFKASKMSQNKMKKK